MFNDGKVWAHFHAHKWKQIRWKVSMSSFLCLVMGVFRIVSITILECFFKSNGVSWIQFYKRTSKQTKRIFCYGSLFVKLMVMQPFINKPWILTNIQCTKTTKDIKFLVFQRSSLLAFQRFSAKDFYWTFAICIHSKKIRP
jgi:hypothetical protein